jgi:hypothetical protein
LDVISFGAEGMSSLLQDGGIQLFALPVKIG